MNAKSKKFLLLLADRLENLPAGTAFSMNNYERDALYFATQIPEFKKAGFVLAHNDNRAPGRPSALYKKHYSLEAAVEFFGIDRNQADHLFGHLECDPWGVQRKSIFADALTSFGGVGRENEPPGWTAGRIRLFVREYPTFQSYKTSVAKEA